MSDEQQIAALREEIRRAGRSTRCVRRVVGSLAFAPFGAIAFYGLAVGLPFFVHQPPAALVILSLFIASFAAGSFGVASAVAIPTAAVVRGIVRWRLSRQLVGMPPTDCGELLRPLEYDGIGDTRKIAASLARSLRIPTELAPAVAPAARGDEASPAERAP